MARWAVVVALIVGGVFAGSAKHATAQTVVIESGDPLVDVLTTLRTNTPLDLVFADRLVEDIYTSCTYEYEEDPLEEVLACVLDGTGLEANRVRRNQYVLVQAQDRPDPEGPTVSPSPRLSISGYVRDAETGEVLPGANIVMRELRSGTSTNRSGYFVLSSLPPGPYQVRITYMGYESVDTTLTAGGSNAHIELAPRSLEADEVVVQDNDNALTTRAPTAGMSTLALDQLDNLPSLGESDLIAALQWTPGVQRSGAVSGGLSVRGASTDQNLYLLEGAPIYHPWHAFSLVSTFQTETLKQTSLYRGTFPAEHGGRLSAIVDAQLKDGNRTEPKAQAALSILSGRFHVESPISERTSFMVAGRRSYIDRLVGRVHPIDEGGRRDTMRTGYVFYDTSAKLTTQLDDRNRFSISYYHGRDDLDLRLPFDLSLDFSSWLRPTDLFFEMDQDWSNRMMSAQYQGIPSPSVVVNATGYYSGYRANESAFVQPTTTASLVSDYAVSVDDMGLRVDVDLHQSMTHMWRFGTHLSHLYFTSELESSISNSATATASPTASGPDREETTRRVAQLAGYAQHTWTPTPELDVQSGVRLSYFSSGQYFHVRPRFNMQYVFDPQWLTVQLGGSGHVQALHRMRDRFSLAYDLVSTRWVPSDREVRPAESWQVTLGARSQPRSSLYLEANTYARWSQHALVPENTLQTKDGLQGPGIEVGALLGQYTPSRERAVGAEAEVRWERGRWRIHHNTAVGRTFTRTPEQEETSGYRPADLDLPWSMRNSITWEPGRWELTLAGTLRTGYPISTPVGSYRLGDVEDTDPVTFLYRPHVNNDRLPLYGRVDATLGHRFRGMGADWHVRLHLHNAINHRNVVGRAYESDGNNGVTTNDQRGLPIIPLFEVQLTL